MGRDDDFFDEDDFDENFEYSDKNGFDSDDDFEDDDFFDDEEYPFEDADFEYEDDEYYDYMLNRDKPQEQDDEDYGYDVQDDGDVYGSLFSGKYDDYLFDRRSNKDYLFTPREREVEKEDNYEDFDEEYDRKFVAETFDEEDYEVQQLIQKEEEGWMEDELDSYYKSKYGYRDYFKSKYGKDKKEEPQDKTEKQPSQDDEGKK